MHTLGVGPRHQIAIGAQPQVFDRQTSHSRVDRFHFRAAFWAPIVIDSGFSVHGGPGLVSILSGPSFLLAAGSTND
jgi:hypothetical protein